VTIADSIIRVNANVDVTMATADEQIRVSDRVKRELDRLRREGESYNDVLERVLDEDRVGDFYDGFGRWSDEEAERVREGRRKSKEKRKQRMRERAEDTV
jgi:predicted CopG family antitoxin